MKRMFRFTQNRRSAILLFSISLLLSSGLLTGCADGLLAEDAPLPEARSQETPYQDYVSSKLRHAPLRERALGSAGTTSSGPVSLIIGMDETILEADPLVSRSRLVSSHDYEEVFYGLAAAIYHARFDRCLHALETDPDTEKTRFT